MERSEAIEIVRKNWPDSGYSQLREALETLVPELKESEDERVRKGLIDYFNDFSLPTFGGLNPKKILTWLEKQGEQKSVPFKTEHGKYYYCIKDYFSGGKKQASKGDVVQALRGLPIMGLDDASEFFLPVNNGINHNNCPKFKVGDWVISTITKEVEQVIELTDCEYICSGHLIVSFNEQHLLKRWTIQDAKDGDVLAASDGSIFLFKSVVDDACKHYIALTNDNAVKFNEGLEHYWETSRAVHPATKEQRDLLFQKMKEAGYKWDAENKELKKIEQPKLTKFEDAIKDMMDDYRDAIDENDATVEEVKEHAAYLLSLIPQNTAWNEEDDINLGKAIWYVENPAPMVVKDSMLVEWLKSFKERVQPKREWSEEDEDMVDDIIKAIHHLLKENESWNFLEDCLEWLKFLKERYTWKPSDEQMEALDDFIYAKYPNIEKHGAAVKSLYNDLKGLSKI